MQPPRTRRVQRIRLATPLVARLGVVPVVLVEISLLGARIEHQAPLSAGSRARLAFTWEDQEIRTEARIVRSRLERFSVGTDGLTVYHSGLDFDETSVETSDKLKAMISRFISRALEEQKMNARGQIPQHQPDRMPIFREGGQLTADSREVSAVIGESALPTARIATETGYICFVLEKNQWKKKRTSDPGQPVEGFTISATEDPTQSDLLCQAYLRADAEGRRLIQLFAQLSIVEGEGIRAGRFQP